MLCCLQLRSQAAPCLLPAGWNMGDVQEGKETLQGRCNEEHLRDPQRACLPPSLADVKFIADETLDFGGLSPSDRYQPLSLFSLSLCLLLSSNDASVSNSLLLKVWPLGPGLVGKFSKLGMHWRGWWLVCLGP